VIVAKESAKSGATTDRGAWRSRWCGRNQPVLDALVIPLAVVMGLERGQRPSQAGLTHEHEAVQTFLFDRPHEPLGVRALEDRLTRGALPLDHTLKDDRKHSWGVGG
jgi:hypothetical protein